MPKEMRSGITGKPANLRLVLATPLPGFTIIGLTRLHLLTCASMEAAGYVDGTVGRKQFYQAKGYAVTDCYNRFTDNQYSGGFSFEQYKDEIDVGRPVMINLEGHTIVGVGYADPNTVYIHDTWDNQTHAMPWGGSYAGMDMVAVSIVNLAPSNYSVLRVTQNWQ